MFDTCTTTRHHAEDLSGLFNTTFDVERTILVPNTSWPLEDGTADEPVYLPADRACPFNRIVYAHGFFASALHEIAHWCIAGAERRKLLDYGYWYEPDNRDIAQQTDFERVEVKPQALEMAFSEAARFPFRVSVDNLSGIPIDRDGFARRVSDQCERFRRDGFPARARRFLDALREFYRE